MKVEKRINTITKKNQIEIEATLEWKLVLSIQEAINLSDMIGNALINEPVGESGMGERIENGFLSSKFDNLIMDFVASAGKTTRMYFADLLKSQYDYTGTLENDCFCVRFSRKQWDCICEMAGGNGIIGYKSPLVPPGDQTSHTTDQ